MKNISESYTLSAFRTTFAVFACLLILATTAYAANYSNSLSVPPGGNPPALVDVSATYAEKSGGFWADSIGTTNGFCIGASCITSWPWLNTAATCQMDTMIKQNQNPGGATPVGSGCTLSAAEVSAGWIVQSWDYCSWVHSADCAGWKYCTYSRLNCSGAVVVTPGTLYRGTPYYTQGYYEGTYGGDGGGDGGACFKGDTLILMADGSEKKIADVQIGDFVLSANEVTGEHTISTVTKTFIHTGSYETILLNGITVTPEHKFKVLRDGAQSWLPAREIHVGDSLVTRDGTVVVASVAQNGNQEAVYNLTTVPSHTYYAGGVLVHNVKDGGGDGGGGGSSLE